MPEKIPTFEGKKGNGRIVWLIVLIVIVVLILICLISWLGGPKTSGYQAVFLSNGQVYFGKVSKLSRQYAELEDIYYLQLTKPLQTQEPPLEGEAATQSKLTLMKLGNELHGPKDTMIINQKHILFVENLKDDSKVVEAIKQYQVQQAEKTQQAEQPVQ